MSMKTSWIVIWQPVDAEQFDASTMKVIDCWTQFSGHKAAYATMNERYEDYKDEHGHGKISLFEGDLIAHHLMKSL